MNDLDKKNYQRHIRNITFILLDEANIVLFSLSLNLYVM